MNDDDYTEEDDFEVGEEDDIDVGEQRRSRRIRVPAMSPFPLMRPSGFVTQAQLAALNASVDRRVKGVVSQTNGALLQQRRSQARLRRDFDSARQMTLLMTLLSRDKKFTIKKDVRNLAINDELEVQEKTDLLPLVLLMGAGSGGGGDNTGMLAAVLLLKD